MHRPPTILTLVLPCPAILNAREIITSGQGKRRNCHSRGVLRRDRGRGRCHAQPRAPGSMFLTRVISRSAAPAPSLEPGDHHPDQPQRSKATARSTFARFDNRDHRTRRVTAGGIPGSPSGSTSMRPPAPSSMAATPRISTAPLPPQPMGRYFGGSHSGNALESAGGLDRRVHREFLFRHDCSGAGVSNPAPPPLLPE